MPIPFLPIRIGLINALLCRVGLAYLVLDSYLQHKAGDVIDTTDKVEVEAALDEVLKTTWSDREIAIGLACMSQTLSNPRFFLKDGTMRSSLPNPIGHGKTGLMLFTKHASKVLLPLGKA